MGATCCKSDTAPSADATVDAKPAMDSSLQALPPVSGGNSEEERIFSVKLTKSTDRKLGLDVDYMVERSILPIMTITGGVAEQWNREHPELPISKGDSILEVNGVAGDVANMLDKCKTDMDLELKLCKCLSYDYLVADLEKLIVTKACGPLLIRLSWHDAGVFNGVDGCPNAALRITGSGENALAENAGLPDVALNMLKSISDKYVPRLISHADLWALAANVAIKAMGGPDIPTRFGRLDSKSASEGLMDPQGRLLAPEKDAQHLREVFGAKGFDEKDVVALSGAHTVGQCHLDRSGFQGQWTDDKLKFDNSYFKDLINKTWVEETNAKGKPQYRCGSNMMLKTDMALMEDGFKVHVEKYANDQQQWFDDFTKAWVKLQEFATGDLRDIL